MLDKWEGQDKVVENEYPVVHSCYHVDIVGVAVMLTACWRSRRGRIRWWRMSILWYTFVITLTL